MKKLFLFLIAHLVAMEEPTREVSVYNANGDAAFIQLPKTIILYPLQMAEPETKQVIAQLLGDGINADYIGRDNPDEIDKVTNDELFFIQEIRPGDPNPLNYTKSGTKLPYIVIKNLKFKVTVEFYNLVRFCGSTNVGSRFSDLTVSLHDDTNRLFYSIAAKFTINNNQFVLYGYFIEYTHTIHDMVKIMHESMLGFCNKLDVEGISGPLIEQEWQKIIHEYFETQTTLISMKGGGLYKIKISSPHETYKSVIIDFDFINEDSD